MRAERALEASHAPVASRRPRAGEPGGPPRRPADAPAQCACGFGPGTLRQINGHRGQKRHPECVKEAILLDAWPPGTGPDTLPRWGKKSHAAAPSTREPQAPTEGPDDDQADDFASVFPTAASEASAPWLGEASASDVLRALVEQGVMERAADLGEAPTPGAPPRLTLAPKAAGPRVPGESPPPIPLKVPVSIELQHVSVFQWWRQAPRNYPGSFDDWVNDCIDIACLALGVRPTVEVDPSRALISGALAI